MMKEYSFRVKFKESQSRVFVAIGLVLDFTTEANDNLDLL